MDNSFSLSRIPIRIDLTNVVESPDRFENAEILAEVFRQHYIDAKSKGGAVWLSRASLNLGPAQHPGYMGVEWLSLNDAITGRHVALDRDV